MDGNLFTIDAPLLRRINLSNPMEFFKPPSHIYLRLKPTPLLERELQHPRERSRDGERSTLD